MTRVDPESVTVPTEAGEMPAHLWRPASGSGPGLLLLQEIFGVSGYIRRRAADLADAGYVVLLPSSTGGSTQVRSTSRRPVPSRRRWAWPSGSTGRRP